MIGDGRERKGDRVDEGVVVDRDILVVDFSDRGGLIGFENEVKLLVLAGGESKLTGVGGR